MERRCDFFVLSCWPPLQNPRAVELTEAIFLPYRQNLGLFFSLYSQAKQQRRKAVALLPRMKDRRPNTTLMLLLMSYGGLVSMLRQKKRLVFSSFFLSFFWPLHMNNDLFQAIEGLFRRSGGAGWQEGFND